MGDNHGAGSTTVLPASENIAIGSDPDLGTETKGSARCLLFRYYTRDTALSESGITLSPGQAEIRSR